MAENTNTTTPETTEAAQQLEAADTAGDGLPDGDQQQNKPGEAERAAGEQEAGHEDTGKDEAAKDNAGKDDAGEGKQTKLRTRIAGAARPRVLVPSVAFLLVLAAAVFFGVNYFQYQGQESARSTALATGKRILNNFMSFDYKKLNNNVDAVTKDASTGFRSQYRRLVDQLQGTIKKAKASSKPDILGSGVTRVDGDRADLVFLANTTVQNTQVKAPRVDPWRVRLTLVKQDGSWKLDGLSFM